MVKIQDYDKDGLRIRIGSRKGKIVFIGFPDNSVKDGWGEISWLEKRLDDFVEIGEGENSVTAFKEIGEYLDGKRKFFDFPVEMVGTEFQNRVWTALTKIEYGHKVSYSDLAVICGCPQSVRAVANAVGANLLSVVIPCHRIIGKTGLGGYAWGGNLKERLLMLEKKTLIRCTNS